MTTTEIFDRTAVDAPCGACQGSYRVTLGLVALSQDLMDEGCTVHDERECPPLGYSRLADRAVIARARRGFDVSGWLEAQEEIVIADKPTAVAPPVPGADTRVLDYVARAPMTYPVPFELLPPKWPKKA
jgi:hypothetical protein